MIRIWFALLMVVFGNSTSCFGQDLEAKEVKKLGEEKTRSAKESSPVVKLPKIQAELKERAAKDQAARIAAMEVEPNEDGQILIDMDAPNNMVAVDKKNTAWLKEQVKKHGWLGKTLVGDQGAKDAWLLVQHADMDLEFQKECLALMNAMPAGEVAAKNVAYLTDRVLCAEDKPQRYGTQCIEVNGTLEPRPVEDRENLNKRRAEVGLNTIENYLTWIRANSPPPAEKKEESSKLRPLTLAFCIASFALLLWALYRRKRSVRETNN